MTYTLYKYIRYIKIADYFWQNITMDFITKLPKSENLSIEKSYNSISIILDKLTKYIYLISNNENSIIRQIVWIVLDRIIHYHGISEIIISDRDKIFMNNFWQTIIVEVGTKLRLLIVYYPQTNKHIKRTNQTLEIYLRYYVSYSQKSWVYLLLMTQLVLNNRIVTIIKESVFFANFGRHSNLFNMLKDFLQAETVLQNVDQLKVLYREILLNIEYI